MAESTGTAGLSNSKLLVFLTFCGTSTLSFRMCHSYEMVLSTSVRMFNEIVSLILSGVVYIRQDVQ